MRGAGGKKKPARGCGTRAGEVGSSLIGEGSIEGEPVLSRLAQSIRLVDSPDPVRWLQCGAAGFS
jgi:hypothetical protein